MGIRIIDGGGRGFEALVNSDGHLVVDAITISEIGHVSQDHGLSFSWTSGTYDPAAADTILLVKNTSTSKNLLITSIWLSSDVETRVQIHIPTSEVTPTGTAITGVNLNSGSNNVADATAIRDETDNTQGNLVWSGEIQILGTPYEVDFQGSLVIAQNDSIGVDYVADAAVVDVVIMGYFE